MPGSDRTLRWPRWLNGAVKLVFVGLLVFSVIAAGQPQFAGKAMGTRAAVYPIAALIVPLVWLATGRRGPYPHLIDALVVVPFVIDLGGNAADLYDSLVWFDDVAHLVNWMLLVIAVGLTLARGALAPPVVAGLALGFGATTHIIWEIGEYLVTQISDSNLFLTYEDTIGDLALSLTGSFLGAATVWVLTRRARPSQPR
ncbi:MAG: hypothetical protein ACR2NA_06500 [Solirubrobacterales bacterium]